MYVEHRIFLRVNVDWKARITSGPKNFEVLVKNVSLGGMSLISENILLAGERFLIDIPLANRLEIEVVWANGKQVGVRFANEDQKANIRQMIYTLWKNNLSPKSLEP